MLASWYMQQYSDRYYNVLPIILRTSTDRKMTHNCRSLTLPSRNLMAAGALALNSAASLSGSLATTRASHGCKTLPRSDRRMRTANQWILQVSCTLKGATASAHLTTASNYSHHGLEQVRDGMQASQQRAFGRGSCAAMADICDRRARRTLMYPVKSFLLYEGCSCRGQ